MREENLNLISASLFQDQMAKLESLAKSGARIQPQKDGSVLFRTLTTTETTQHIAPQQQLQVRSPASLLKVTRS